MEHCPFIGDWHRSIKLGCGAFSEVWLWQNAKSKEEIVVKTCNLPVSPEEACKHKKCRENEVDLMMNKIRHLNIVRGIKVNPDTFLIELTKQHQSEMPILITPYCKGGDLRRQLNDNGNASGMVEMEVRGILQALTNALLYLHSLSIIHRDIKPESVLIHLSNDGQRIYKLADAGNSKPIDFRHIESGKTSYMAPELIINMIDRYGYSVDYWSMGVLAYEIITGSRPFVPHLPLAQWILRVREKKSEHIAIHEDDDGEFIYSNKIVPENQLSNRLSELLGNWLQLALEWNPKQRGHIFEKSNIAPNLNTLDSHANAPPVQVLKLFQTIDDILVKKILTIFVLTNHKNLSIEIDENTKMEDLIAFIEREVSIAAAKCHIILPKLDTTIETDVTKDNCKPIDFYIDNGFDMPMVFVTQISSSMTDDKQTEENIAAEIPPSVQNIISKCEKPSKMHTLRKLRKCARDALHFVRNENKKYKNCLNGWFHYAVQLNSKIELCQRNVQRMQCLIYGVSGALEIYMLTFEMANEQFMDHDGNWLEKIKQNIERLVNACDKITVRHSSLHRRSREAIQHELLLKRNNKDFYDITNLTKAYDTLFDQMSQNNLSPKPHVELSQCVYKCLKQRESLLRNKAFIEMQRNVNRIHIELIEIKKALEKSVVLAKKYRSEIIEANKRLHECSSAWYNIQKMPKVQVKMVSTSTTDLVNTTSTELKDDDDDFGFVEGIQYSSDHLKQTRSIVEENINLRISIANVMNDIDEQLRNSIK